MRRLIKALPAALLGAALALSPASAQDKPLDPAAIAGSLFPKLK